MKDYTFEHTIRICPKCGKKYRGIPATSREDGETMICPDCGIREALQSIGIEEEEREQILKTIHKYMDENVIED